MRKRNVAILVCSVGLVLIIGIVCIAIWLHKSNTADVPTTSIETVGETIPSKEYAEVIVEYKVPLTEAGGASVPDAVYNYRLEHPVEYGTIMVIAYSQEDNTLHVVMDINGEEVEYAYEIASPYEDD